jgi:hypothetical protein
MQGTLVYLSIILALGLAGLGVLAMAVFGAWSMARGKVEPLKAGILAVPFVIMGILGLTMETWSQAGIFTLVVMLGLTILGLVSSGVRNLVT